MWCLGPSLGVETCTLEVERRGGRPYAGGISYPCRCHHVPSSPDAEGVEVASLSSYQWERRDLAPPPPSERLPWKEGKGSWAWVRIVAPWEGAGEVASVGNRCKEGHALASRLAAGGRSDDVDRGSTWKQGRALR